MFSGIELYAQPERKWSIKLDGGFSIPISKFSKVDVTNTISFQDGYLLAEYFDKKGNGAAENGKYFSISVRRKFLEKFLVSLGTGKSINTVSTYEINDHYDKVFFDDPFYFVFSQVDYEVNYIIAGIGYIIDGAIWKASFQPLLGMSTLKYPNYNMKGYTDESWGDEADQLRFEASHRGETKDPKSIIYGIASSFDFILFNRITLGVDLRYLMANYHYSIEPHTTGFCSKLRNDIVNYRVIDLGLSIGVAF